MKNSKSTQSIVEASKTTFEPQILGFDERFHTEALRAWNHLINVTCDLLVDVVSFLDEEDITTAQFMNLLSLSPGAAIVKMYESKGLSIPGMNTKKLIELGIVSNEYSSAIDKGFKQFHKANEEAQKLFKFDISLLRDTDGLFCLNAEFEKKLKEFCTLYTKSEKENEALFHLRQMVSGLNYFAQVKLINPAYGPKSFEPVLWGIRSSKVKNGYETVLNPFRLSRWNTIFN